jgi:putative membrane protein
MMLHMKQLIRQILLIIGTVAILMSLSFCGGKQSDESKSIAEDKNAEKFDTKAGEKDAQFVVDGISESYAEMLLAGAAVEKSKDQEVKDVAALLKKEYANSLSDLKKFASAKAISVPTEATDEDRKKVQDISSEKEFDKVWCGEMRERHRKMIDELENAATSLNDSELKAWAGKTLTSVRAHHDKIMACHERLK